MISRHTFIAAAAVLAVITGAVVAGSDETAPTQIPQCRTEDSVNCVWIGPSMGNREGRDFVDIDGHTHYLDGKP